MEAEACYPICETGSCQPTGTKFNRVIGCQPDDGIGDPQRRLDGYISFDIMHIKLVAWLGDSLDRVRDFPDEACGRTGFELWEVQQGNEPSDWKPMPSIGIGVNEIRVREGGAFRLI